MLEAMDEKTKSPCDGHEEGRTPCLHNIVGYLGAARP